MKLSSRLIVAFTVLLLVVVALVGFVAVRSTRRVLIDQIDDRIVAVLNQTGRFRPDRPGPGERPGPGADRFLAELVLGPDGDVLRASPSGLEGDPDPLPDIRSLAAIPESSARIITIPASSGGFQYRAGIARNSQGLTVVFAQPLREIAVATRAITRRLLQAGALVTIIGGGAVWYTVRRGLRPVDDMIETASAIADGDLTRRVPAADPDSELGQLGTALNHMLASLEGAFATETRANQTLKQFVADASHELRTPLAAISGYTELYRNGALVNPLDADNAMRRIEAESKRMRRLVDDLLMLARLDQTQTLERRPVEVVAMARDAVADSEAIDPGHEMTVDAPVDLWMEADGEQLVQVVSNLLANVRSHTPTGTRTSVTVNRVAGDVVIKVTDSGPGFPPEAIPNVFDRFFRADPSRSRRSGGAGLGLAIVDAIARAHGGHVEATNRPTGGACVTVYLPATQES